MNDAARIYQLMVLTAWADGHLHPLEQGMAGQLLHDLPDLQGVEDRTGLAQAARDLLARRGLRDAVDEVASGIGDHAAQRLAIICCARVLAADGRLATEEFSVMSQLRKRFGLPMDEMKRLLDAGMNA